MNVFRAFRRVPTAQVVLVALGMSPMDASAFDATPSRPESNLAPDQPGSKAASGQLWSNAKFGQHESNAASAQPRSSSASGQLASAVREMIEQRCGSCHDSARDTAKPAALKVFDLKEDDWTARMSNDQLKKVIGRVNGTDLPAAKRQQVAAFINVKLAQRSVP